jgi:hypothetical protein
MIRRRLPQRRCSETRSLRFRNRTLTITVGFYPTGEIGEVFTDMARSGEDLAVIANDIPILLSLALQHGVALATIRHAISRDSSGEAASVVGAIIDSIGTEN